MNHLLRQAEIVKKRKGDVLETFRLWIFAHNGITGKAAEQIRQHGIRWSSRAEMQAVNPRKLPELEE